MREIALDTETTGLDPKEGHKVIEIGCVEMINRVRTGNNYHVYCNPKRDIPQEAFAVHGISEEFLADKPIFSVVANDFLAFIDNAPLVIHNASFDMRFINAELEAIGHIALGMERAVDTLMIARKKFPGAPASLDALCKRFEIDLSRREKHGALLDAELLADVYLELMGGSQETLALTSSEQVKAFVKQQKTEILEPRSHSASKEEKQDHENFVAEKIKEPAWDC